MFNDRNVHTGTRKLSPKRYLKYRHLSPSGLNFIPPKKTDYTDFLTQFELLYKNIVMFEIRFKNRNFLKKKLKCICFSTLII